MRAAALRVQRAGEDVLRWMLGKPRTLQAAAVLLCGLLALHSFALHPSRTPAVTPFASTPTHQPSVVARQTGTDADTPAAIAAVERYNQASIAAGRTGDVSLLAPLLVPNGPAWSAIQAEYARRLAATEQHDAVLRRWGVLESSIQGDSAIVVTQELWDDVARSAGRITASEHGLLARNTYTLRRGSSGWLIVDVQSEAIVR